MRPASVAQTAKNLGTPSATLDTRINQLKTQPKTTKKPPMKAGLICDRYGQEKAWQLNWCHCSFEQRIAILFREVPEINRKIWGDL
ncbi:hypothetical protein BGC07_01235 [Piscirickettsia litoralis]|uniref:Uncharacterized protein n=1 Tax=Piscirickettsia litoralis TaxID=1891921 RepID=A0ABX2ZZ07_9GAMM|nr:hypothetical protein BGC07_01235 [Piscirickettsia litoralis]